MPDGPCDISGGKINGRYLPIDLGGSQSMRLLGELEGAGQDERE